VCVCECVWKKRNAPKLTPPGTALQCDDGLAYCSFRPNPHDIYIHITRVPVYSYRNNNNNNNNIIIVGWKKKTKKTIALHAPPWCSAWAVDLGGATPLYTGSPFFIRGYSFRSEMYLFGIVNRNKWSVVSKNLIYFVHDDHRQSHHNAEYRVFFISITGLPC